jgi:hypothetical protein
MTHRRFTFETHHKRRYTNYTGSKSYIDYTTEFKKYLPSKEKRLYILFLCVREGGNGIYLNTLGGVANDEHIKWLVDREMGSVSRSFHHTSHHGGYRDINYTFFTISEKGKQYLKKHITNDKENRIW